MYIRVTQLVEWASSWGLAVGSSPTPGDFFFMITEGISRFSLNTCHNDIKIEYPNSDASAIFHKSFQ